MPDSRLTADRYSYLPGLGFALVVGAAAGAVVRAGAAGTLRPWLARALAGLGVVWFCGLAYLSDQQVRIWRDTESIWRSAAESGPECARCRNNFGVMLARQGYFELAKTEFECALALRPDHEGFQRNLVEAILDARARGAPPLRSSP